MRGREIASLQSKLAAAEAESGAAAQRARRAADADAERVRAALQADITALTLQNKLVGFCFCEFADDIKIIVVDFWGRIFDYKISFFLLLV